MTCRSTVIALLICVCASAVSAQQTPPKWGDVPDGHFAMTSYAGDAEAHAVILADYGVAEVESDWKVSYDRHRRIKILDEAGYDFANVTLTYYAEDKHQRVRGIKGHTLVRGADGRVQRTDLEKSSIFEEDLEGGRKRIKFTLPALEPGAVIEYRYTIDTKSPFRMPTWSFQDEEPVLYSEFKVTFPQTLAYTMVTHGNPSFTVQEETEGVRRDGQISIWRWVAEDVPALREERYMTTLEDYVQKLEIQLVEYYRQGYGAVRVVKTWDQMVEELREDTDFGRKLEIGGAVRDEALALTNGLGDNDAKARAIYAFVQRSIVWDETYRAFPDRRLDHVLRDKRGSSAEINLLLTAMLREAGLPAAPALLSTRAHGKITRQYPVVSHFNYAAAALKQGGQWQLLDATDPFLPYGLLPVATLNESALLVLDSGPSWVDVARGTSDHAVSVQATLSPDGSLSGTLRSEKNGYAGVWARERVRDEGAESYVSGSLVEDVAGIEIRDVRLTGQGEPEVPLVAEVDFHVPAYAQSVGELMLVNPLLLLRTDENPFKLERRSYPVDFPYPFSSTYAAEIVVPEGFVVDEAPDTALLLLPMRGGAYERTIETQADTLKISARTDVRKTVFEPNVYDSIKQFFERMVAADAETVVLKRAPVAEAGEDASEDSASHSADTEGN